MSATSGYSFPISRVIDHTCTQEYALGFVGIVFPWLGFLISGITHADYLKAYEVICTFDLCLPEPSTIGDVLRGPIRIRVGGRGCLERGENSALSIWGKVFCHCLLRLPAQLHSC